MRTRDRMYLGRIRSVRDISRDDKQSILVTSNFQTDFFSKKICLKHSSMSAPVSVSRFEFTYESSL